MKANIASKQHAKTLWYIDDVIGAAERNGILEDVKTAKEEMEG